MEFGVKKNTLYISEININLHLQIYSLVGVNQAIKAWSLQDDKTIWQIIDYLVGVLEKPCTILPPERIITLFFRKNYDDSVYSGST